MRRTRNVIRLKLAILAWVLALLTFGKEAVQAVLGRPLGLDLAFVLGGQFVEFVSVGAGFDVEVGGGAFGAFGERFGHFLYVARGAWGRMSRASAGAGGVCDLVGAGMGLA